MNLQYDAVHWDLTGDKLRPLNPPKDLNYPAEAEVQFPVQYGIDFVYTGTLLPGGQKPAVPVLTFLDNFDGSTAVATVAGSSAGTTNTIYAKPENSTDDPVLIATISGDGSATVTLGNTGIYLAYVLSTSIGEKESIGFAVFSISSGSADLYSLFETTGASPTRDAFYTVFAVPVMYQRGAAQTVLRAIPSDSASKYSEITGFEIETGSRDWCVRSADLVIGGGRVQPKRGDTIRDNLGNLWQILPRDGAPPYIEADPEGVELVIRTKQVERP